MNILEFNHNETDFFKAIKWDVIMEYLNDETFVALINAKDINSIESLNINQETLLSTLYSLPIEILIRLVSGLTILYYYGNPGPVLAKDFLASRLLVELVLTQYKAENIKKSIMVEKLEKILYKIKNKKKNIDAFRGFLLSLFNELMVSFLSSVFHHTEITTPSKTSFMAPSTNTLQ